MTAERKSKILLVDDQAPLRRPLRHKLEAAGYAVREAQTGAQVMGEFTRHAPDLVILDFWPPGSSGPEVLRGLRALHSAPVLVLSDWGEETNKVAALDAGADDYLTKPFGEAELLARLRALLRRVRPVASMRGKYRFGPIELDLARRRVLCEGRSIRLTATEYSLLRLLVMNRDNVLTHRHILRELWGPHAEGYVHYLRTYMMRLRRKFGQEVSAAGYFQTESSVGYRFVSEPARNRAPG
jgi:two-component system KDP operon response regulator KdpE